jgi:hypothetical protein
MELYKELHAFALVFFLPFLVFNLLSLLQSYEYTHQRDIGSFRRDGYLFSIIRNNIIATLTLDIAALSEVFFSSFSSSLNVGNKADSQPTLLILLLLFFITHFFAFKWIVKKHGEPVSDTTNRESFFPRILFAYLALAFLATNGITIRELFYMLRGVP